MADLQRHTNMAFARIFARIKFLGCFGVEEWLGRRWTEPLRTFGGQNDWKMPILRNIGFCVMRHNINGR